MAWSAVGDDIYRHPKPAKDVVSVVSACSSSNREQGQFNDIGAKQEVPLVALSRTVGVYQRVHFHSIPIAFIDSIVVHSQSFGRASRWSHQ